MKMFNCKTAQHYLFSWDVFPSNLLEEIVEMFFFRILQMAIFLLATKILYGFFSYYKYIARKVYFTCGK